MTNVDFFFAEHDFDSPPGPNGAAIVEEQVITVARAVLLYTGRSRTVGDFGRIGLIAPGYEARFITLSDDIFAVHPRSIMDLEVSAPGPRVRRSTRYRRPVT